MILDETRQGFEFFEREFGMPYPFSKYDQLFVPEFNSGAMENAGCVTLHEDYVFRSRVPEVSYERRAVTILHEMAHMWFGDLVTMTWWDDLWLNESFAEWASTLATAEATRWTSAWTTFANTDKTWAYRQDQLPSTHPIAAEIHDLEDVEVNFDGITYAKGASVLKLLVAWVGREEFLAGIREYFRAYAWGNTTLADLLGEAGGDLRPRPEGLVGRVARDRGGQHPAAVLRGRRRGSLHELRGGAERAGRLADAALAPAGRRRSTRRVDQGLVRRDRVELDVTGARTEVPELVGVAQPDLVLVNDDDLTYAKVRLDERSLRTLTDSLGEFEDTLARSLCWSAAWDMTRDGEMTTRDYLTLVLGGIGRETDSSVTRTVLRQAETAVVLYSSPGRREDEPAAAGRRAAAAARRGRARQRQPAPVPEGVRRRLRWATSTSRPYVATSTARTSSRACRSTPTCAGTCCTSLVAAGRADDAEIDRELDRDDTATGRRQAAAALAARPSGEAKAEAWASVMDDDELPNAIQTAVIGGFQQVGQLELLRSFVDPYFASLTDVWSTRTNETAQSIVIGFFPTLLAEQSTVDAADAWLAANADAVPALRRLVHRVPRRRGPCPARPAEGRRTAAA